VAGFLFDNIVFGPVYSRRLGVSLGINLLPNNSKYCNFNCIYCECGWTEIKKGEKIVLPERSELKSRLTEKLQSLKGTVNEPDTITFAGNGEPTIHPDFPGIIDDTIEIRDRYAPKAQISVLSNASMLHKPKVVEALKKIELNIQKLDSGIESTFNRINQTSKGLSFEKIVKGLLTFDGKLIVQTLFLRGEYNGHFIDNTTPEEIEAWLQIVKKINPEYVMIYPIDRGTPAKNIQKIPEEKLKEIAAQVENEGLKTKVYY
jgi:wyosine [tRNA(Phe)-imidazoG37] synthetase (radical SAM superfamily)